MKVVICFPIIPFMFGGADKAVHALYDELAKRGHEVELIKIPFKEYPALKILDGVVSCKLLDLKESNGKKIDLLISTKFPSYVVDHPNQVIWLFHQYRPAYDLRNTQYDNLKSDPDGEFVRNKIIEIDNKCLRRVKKVFTISKIVAERLDQFSKVKSEVLYIPVPNATKFHNKEYGDYVLYPSRISAIKRQDLLIDAIKHTKSGVKCKIIGFEEDEKWFDKKLKDSQYRERIELLTNVTDDELVELYSKALAVVFLPYDEDYGFVTLEAFYSEKPILITSDSGGPLEFVEDHVNGFIVEPEPKLIALKLDELYENKENTKRMGKAAKEKVEKLNLNWDLVIEKLTT